MADSSHASMSDDSIRDSLKALNLSTCATSPTSGNLVSGSTSATASVSPPSILSLLPTDSHDNTDLSDFSEDEEADQPPLFDIRSTKTHGLAVFATRRIPAGALIFSEPPLISLSKAREVDHSAVEEAFDSLFKEDRKSYLTLYDAKKSRMSRVASIYYSNCYSKDDFISTTNHEGGSCIGRISSRMNHSCLPNVCFSYVSPSEAFPTGQMRFHACKNIPAGKELLSCYEKNIFLTRQERVSRCVMYYGFQCDCEACMPRTGFWEKSDERRSEMRRVVREMKGFDREWDASHERTPKTATIDSGERQAVNGELCEKALKSLEKLRVLLIKEGLTHTPLANVYRSLAKWNQRYSRTMSVNHGGAVSEMSGKVREYKQNELEVCVRCFGREAERSRNLQKDLREEM